MQQQVPIFPQPECRYCPTCNKREGIYRKVYYVKDHGEIHTVKSYNNFYVCVNIKCSNHISITTGVKRTVYDETMEWYRYDF